jgi:hypothetical protein
MRPYNNAPQQGLYEQIDYEINNLQQMKERMKNNQLQQPIQPTNLTQNFQIAPQNNSGIKVVNSVEDVQKELAITDTPFVNNNYTTLWIKNAKGEIRTFELKEIKPKDEKDLIIEDLKAQIYQLNNQIKEMNTYEQQHNETSNEYESKQLDESIKNEATSNVSNVKSSKPKSR